MNEDLQNLIIQSVNSGRYFFSINYIEKDRIQHHFVTRDFPVDDLDKCITKIVEYVQKTQEKAKADYIQTEEKIS